MPKFVDGVMRFQTHIFPAKKALFEALSDGQSPEALFITCSDSRIETGMLTQSEPGELFVCRNVGNIVPPHTEHTGGVTASLEFAAAVLKVPHIVICGHTGCGAMEAAIGTQSLSELPHVRHWLKFTDKAVKIVEQTGQGKSAAEKQDMLTEQNVILQLEHLKTHPTVAERLKTGALTLHGWVYHITTGDVQVFDTQKDAFVPTAEYY
ncbi:MAG: carbonic anhydrase [Alphaproteobacteria bacterium]|nr:carbonic anhydrase [Alphaproteobacteria bacterium]